MFLVNKLKTRLKHILDVSDKYATIELFDELCRVVADIDVANIDVDGLGKDKKFQKCMLRNFFI